MANATFSSGANDAVSYDMSDGSTITLSDITTSGPLAEGAAPIIDNPGDLGYYPPTEPYYENVVGTYTNFGVYDTKSDGISALEEYLISHENTSFQNYNVLQVLESPEFGGKQGDESDILQEYGLSPTLALSTAMASSTTENEFIGALTQREGANNSIAITISVGYAESVSLAIAYDPEFLSPSFGGTEISLDNKLENQVVDGSIWYAVNDEDTQSPSVTYSSNVSQSYSSYHDMLINTPWRPEGYSATTAPLFVLGTVDTDTFYNLGDGSTIIAGAADYTLSTDIGGNLTYGEGFYNDQGLTLPYPEEIALPSGFMIDPSSALTGQMASSDLVIVNPNNTSFSASIANQIVIAAGASDTLSAGANNVTLISLGGTGTENILNSGSFSSVTEIASAGMNSSSSGALNSSSIFSFSTGTNVLIGDLGNNTFIENPTVTSATNIIWGGGGESTYSLTGVIDILTTTGTANATAIASLVSDASQLVPEESYYRGFFGIGPMGIDTTIVSESSSIVNANMPVSEIVDPTSNDVLAGFAGIYTPQYSGPSPMDMGTLISFMRVVGDTTYGGGDGPEYGDLALSATNSVTGFSETAIIYNFVNGDLGITFSGSTIVGLGNVGSVPYPDDSEGIYSYSQLDYIDGGTGNSIGSGGGEVAGQIRTAG